MLLYKKMLLMTFGMTLVLVQLRFKTYSEKWAMWERHEGLIGGFHSTQVFRYVTERRHSLASQETGVLTCDAVQKKTLETHNDHSTENFSQKLYEFLNCGEIQTRSNHEWAAIHTHTEIRLYVKFSWSAQN